MALILVVYFVFRIEDLALRGALPDAFSFGTPALLFWLERPTCFLHGHLRQDWLSASSQ